MSVARGRMQIVSWNFNECLYVTSMVKKVHVAFSSIMNNIMKILKYNVYSSHTLITLINGENKLVK